MSEACSTQSRRTTWPLMSMPRMASAWLADLVGVGGQLDARRPCPGRPPSPGPSPPPGSRPPRPGPPPRRPCRPRRRARWGCRSGRSTACPGTRRDPLVSSLLSRRCLPGSAWRRLRLRDVVPSGRAGPGALGGPAQAPSASSRRSRAVGQPPPDGGQRGAGGEHLGHAQGLQRRDVVLGDDAPHDHQDVATGRPRPAPRSPGAPGSGGHPRAATAPRRRRPPGPRRSPPARASGGGRCRRPRTRRRAGPGR